MPQLRRTPLFALLALQACLLSPQTLADADWVSFTYDNDMLVGEDSGYTNGAFLSWFDVGEGETQPGPGILLTPLLWMLPEGRGHAAINAYTLSQVMMTPGDITVADPPPEELPYSGMLSLSNAWMTVHDDYADRISTTIGMVGPVSGAKATQKFVHKLIGSDDPKGWGTQLHNEPVFQFSRGRVWRSWVADNRRSDFLITGEGSLGTISSSVASGVVVRYGSGLDDSYPSLLFGSSRSSNPLAVGGGWYLYAGIEMRYVFNQIFADGNTFRSSRSVDYEHAQVAVQGGLAYAWQDLAISMGFNDTNINEDANQVQDYTRYGTITAAWRF